MSTVHPWLQPSAIATDNLGFVYVLDSYDDKIYKLNADLTVPGPGPGLPTYGSSLIFDINPMNSAHDLANDQNNRLYIADTRHNRIVRIDDNAFNDPTTANLVEFVIPPSTNGGDKFWPLNVAVDSTGHILVSGTEGPYFGRNVKVLLIQFDDMSGANLKRLGGAPGNGTNQFQIPVGMGAR